jgi:3-deoxy-7-phosphoheptulonate synthase
MLILMPLNAPLQAVEKVKKKLTECGCTPHEIPGAIKLGIGVTGPSSKLNIDDFKMLEYVDDVVRVSKPFKLVSREMKSADTIIKIDNEILGDKKIKIIAGPCSVESREQIFEIAGILKELGITFLRGGAYKPRSSPYAFQGLKEVGLKYLQEVKKELGMKIVTEAKDTETLDAVADVADIIQIGARNMQNFSLLERVGKTNKPVLLKRGLSATIEDLLMSAEYIVSQGNSNVILCERGIRTFETYTRNTLDLNAVPVIKQLSNLPIFVDPSHGIGIANKVPAMALAGIAAGADGLIIEVHNAPEKALSDGMQSITPIQFKVLLNKVKAIATILERE